MADLVFIGNIFFTTIYTLKNLQQLTCIYPNKLQSIYIWRSYSLIQVFVKCSIVLTWPLVQLGLNLRCFKWRIPDFTNDSPLIFVYLILLRHLPVILKSAFAYADIFPFHPMQHTIINPVNGMKNMYTVCELCLCITLWPTSIIREMHRFPGYYLLAT